MNRAALVTGGSRGIGRAIALGLAARGFEVGVNYVSNLAAAEETGRHVEQLGRRAVLIRGDVGDGEDRQRIVEEMYSSLGRIDLLVNNAGVAPAVRADILEAS